MRLISFSWPPHKFWPVLRPFLATLLISIAVVLSESASAVGVNPDNAAWLIFDKRYNDYFLLRVDMKTSKVGSARIAGGSRYAGRRFTGVYSRFGFNLLGGQFTVLKDSKPYLVGNFNQAGDEIFGNFLDDEGKNTGDFVGTLKGHTDHQMDLFQLCRLDSDSKYYCANRGRDEACGVGSFRRSSTFFSRANCEDEIWRSSLQREESYVSLGSLKKQTEYLSCRTINGDINGFHEEYAYKEDGRRLWSTYYSKDFLIGPTRRYNEQGLLELLSWHDDYPLAKLQVLKFTYSADQKLETVEHKYPHPVGKGYWDRVWNKNGELVSEVCTGAEDCSASTKDEIYSSQELTIYNSETASVWLGTKSEGVRDGRAIMAFSSGAFRFLSYRAGKLDGDYVHYYSNSGQVQISRYSNGKLEPSYTVRHPCGREERKERKPREKPKSAEINSSVGESSRERQALMDFYEATNGDQWKNKAGWASDKSYCDWFGVTCGSTGKVKRLALYRNNLSGTLSESIGDLSALESLSLTFNRIEGVLPEALPTLSKLRFIALSNNALSGEIPATLSRLSSLVTLSLNNNNFAGQLPAWLPNMTALRTVSLHNNKLSGVITPEVADHYARATAENGTNYILYGNEFDCPQPQQIAELFADGGEFCMDGLRDGGYTGTLVTSYLGGGRLSDATYIDGERHGLARYWYPNGQMYIEWSWRNGMRHGPTRVWFENGQIKRYLPYFDGKANGVRREWDSNGNLKSESCRVDGKKAEMAECETLASTREKAQAEALPATPTKPVVEEPSTVVATHDDGAGKTVEQEKWNSSSNVAQEVPSEGKGSLEAELALRAAELNKSKRTFNNQYELSAVSLGGANRELIYEFAVKTSISELNEPLLTTVAKSVYCSAEKLQIFRDNNIPAVWMYTDRSASSIIIHTEVYDCD